MSDLDTSPAHPDVAAEARAVAAAIAIPAHVVNAKGNGHAGTAMALAPFAHVLFSRVLRHNPANPRWAARDRLVLSAGHASLLLYVQLFLTGYGLTLDDLAASRKLGSLTPGHPELRHTPGIEASTGPLGQGVGNAVGMAIAARKEAAEFTPGTDLFDHTIWVVAGDGCLQEGVSSEASSLAATLGLDNLVMVWDDNSVTIDSLTDETFAEDVRARYRAYGWRVLEVHDSTDLDELERVLTDAADRQAADGRPTFVALKSTIAAPSEKFGGKPAAHAGGFGDDEVARIKQQLGFPPDATLEELVEPDGLAFARRAVDRGRQLEAEWSSRFANWSAENPADAERWEAFESPVYPGAAFAALDDVEAAIAPEGTPVATRKTNGAVISALTPLTSLFGGSADLAGSTNVEVPGDRVSPEHPGGAFVRFGIREHAMAAILSGIALHGPWRPFGSTYLAFSDYMRPSIRLASLMALPVLYVFTHDSVAVGEDGPTHQPVEQIAGLRTVPGLDVVRPADARETVALWRRLLQKPERPTALILSRQDVPVLTDADGLADGVAAGGYVRWQHGEGLDVALIGTGSELQLAIAAAEALAEEGIEARVVSMPCVEWFEESAREWRESVLPSSIVARVAVEAGRGDAWYRWVGLAGEVVSVERFGESGSGPEVLELRGITAEHVLAAARRTLARR
ncbi:transketolase [Cryobacterium sp. BB307]|uniref:transketolase family protein n=1 Tax=Cryobacterium sp. BB307 TaxID=2716317 RepID=UPI001445945F|nr:transketolase [Cryobacterium sp. BB307]